MADDGHLEFLLEQGVDQWNEWRGKNPEIIPDLSGADLSRADLSGIVLNGANLQGAILERTIFVAAHLVNADLHETNLHRASFCEANLSGANLNAANLSEAFLTRARIVDSKLIGADLREAKLNSAYLYLADFSDANLSKAELVETTAIETDFTRANFTGACLKDRCFIRVNLDKVICEYIFLEANQQKRLPSIRKFDLGEFSKLFQADRSYSNLTVLDQLINRFEKLLDDFPEGNESIFHKFLEKNPTLIDIYASQQDIFSKRRFHCPPGKLLNGKKYVEPDFIIRYPGNKYKLVELEKPEKRIATKQGQQTCDVTQAEFQTKEWEDYLCTYTECVRDEYPGITKSRSYLVVLGRRNERSIGIGRDPATYMGLINSNYPHEEICTYDDLLDRAKQAHSALVSLSI